jgi:tetratricopeptide (TPR) repeat protein
MAATFTLKPISRDAVPGALEKAHRYRLLNQPLQAESICLDVLALDPENPEALVGLLLALTDQFARHLQPAFDRARAVLPLLPDAYARFYYEGILCERRGKAHFRSGNPMAGAMAFEWLEMAMAFYDRAEAVRPHGDDDAVLRWNSCARMLMANERIRPSIDDPSESMLE